MSFLRYPRTTQERRVNQNSPFCRAKRNTKNLPTSYDDLIKSRSKCWKKYRKTQYRIVCKHRGFPDFSWEERYYKRTLHGKFV